RIDSAISRIEEELKVKSEEMLEKFGISSVVKELEDVKVKILRNKDRLESNRREIERIDGIIEKLKAIRRSRMGYSKGVQAILKLNKPGVYGTFADIISTPKEYKVAIEVAAGKHLQDIIVENEKVAIQLINYLKKEKIGRATFLPLNKIKRRDLGREKRLLLSRPGVIGVASEIVDYDPRFSNAVSFVLGSTVIVDSINTAKEIGIGKVRMVSIDGDLIEESGLMIGGYYSESGVLDSTELEIKEYERIKEELIEEINFLEVEKKQLEKKLKELEELAEKEEEELVELKKSREELEKKLAELKSKREELFEKKSELEEEANKLRIERARVEAETEKYKMEVEKFGKVEYVDEDPSLLEKRIREIKHELNKIGLVNMKAVEEYEKFKNEFDELKKKYEKIVEEKKAVVDMIDRIEARKKEVFFDCMNKISFFFNEMFKQLTGGSARLELEDPNDLESGLIIKANPSGKRVLNIDAMSGGEKALTALAFLFAIQRYKPAPFYVLDEVDAALDKVNSIKVAKLIKELSKKAQFIVITHNDATIKEADRVYGVTMRNGESKILGLELPEVS
ncbi:MAG TPA: hypothetical protein ENG45_01160, partial [Candidatus Aenigmarchaeota archaeon]|nr:hypothetical protein [Candidatus Aenigmarchaeota archaeon]